jgi:hypothetical protein
MKILAGLRNYYRFTSYSNSLKLIWKQIYVGISPYIIFFFDKCIVYWHGYKESRLTRKWDDNVKMDLKYLVFDGVD